MAAGPKIVISTTGSLGDLHPFLALAQRLKARGMTPVIASRSEFRAKVEAVGVDFHPVRPNLEDIQALVGLDEAGLIRAMMDPAQGARFVIRRLSMPFLKAAYEDVAEAAEGAALIVTHNSAFAARLVAERMRLPWISAVLQPFSIFSAYDPPLLGVIPAVDALRPFLGRWGHRKIYDLMRRKSASWVGPVQALRRELGLSEATAHPLFEGQFSPLGTLGLYSPLLGKVRPDFPPKATLAGFAFFDEGGELPEPLARFLADGVAPLVFTLGSSTVLNAGDFFEASVAAARKLGRRAVLLTGEQGADESLPPSMIACAYAPHALLFSYAEAVIHAGSMGTAAQALRAGVPQLIAPFTNDQPDNARRLARLGVGRTLPRARYEAARVASQLGTLLKRSGYRRKAEAVGEIISGQDGAEAGAAVIERAVGKG